MNKPHLNSRLPPSNLQDCCYKKNIEEHNNTKEELLQMLEMYKKFLISSEETTEREELVQHLMELKTALSDLNIFIHAEREQVAKLQQQNEILKVEQKFTEQKLHFLMLLSNISEDELNSYMRSSNKKVILQQICVRKQRKVFQDTLNCLKDSQPSEIEVFLENKLRVLNEHYKSTEKAWHGEKEALLEERDLQKAESKAQRDADQAHINLLNAKLSESQKLVHEAMKKSIESKTEFIKAKNNWLAEKDKLAMGLKRLRTMNSENLQTYPLSDMCEGMKEVKSICELKELRKDYSALKRELRGSEELRQMREERCKKLEGDTIRLREHMEAQIIIYRNKIKNLEEAKEMYRKQRDKLEERRKREVEGFHSELKLVRNDLRKVVQQFFKLTTFYSENQEMPDIAEINDLKLATSLARSIHHAIIKAKRNMLSIETQYVKEGKE